MTAGSEPWDDWVKTCGKPTVWCGFDWPEIVETYVVLPTPPARCNNLRAVILNIQALAEKGFPIDAAKLATRCRYALANISR